MYMYTFAVFHLENKLGVGEMEKKKKEEGNLTCYFSSYKLSAKYLEHKSGMF